MQEVTQQLAYGNFRPVFGFSLHEIGETTDEDEAEHWAMVCEERLRLDLQEHWAIVDATLRSRTAVPRLLCATPGTPLSRELLVFVDDLARFAADIFLTRGALP